MSIGGKKGFFAKSSSRMNLVVNVIIKILTLGDKDTMRLYLLSVGVWEARRLK